MAVQYYVLRTRPGKPRPTPPGVLAAHKAGGPPPKSKPGVLTTGVVLRVTDGPGTNFRHREQAIGDDFNMLAAPFAAGFFTGDYEGLAPDVRDPKVVHTFFTATTCKDTKCDAVKDFDDFGDPIPSNAPNPTDVFSSSVRAG